MSLFQTPESTQDLLPITLIKGYLSQNQINLLLQESLNYLFTSPRIKVFGQEHQIPRQQVWYADEGCNIVYSHLLIQAMPWPYYLYRLRQQLNQDFLQNYNGVLVNRYRNGMDTMGWHCDNEPEIVTGSDIASISLGAKRDFIVKHKLTNEKHTFSLGSGDLLIMHSPMQENWVHSLPKRTKVHDERLNLTFRTITPYFHT